jgi:hypothetical protein
VAQGDWFGVRWALQYGHKRRRGRVALMTKMVVTQAADFSADLSIKKGDLIVPEVVSQKVLKFFQFTITQRAHILTDDSSEEVRIFSAFLIQKLFKFLTSRITKVSHNQTEGVTEISLTFNPQS